MFCHSVDEGVVMLHLGHYHNLHVCMPIIIVVLIVLLPRVWFLWSCSLGSF